MTYHLIVTVELEMLADDGSVERRGSGVVQDTGTLEHLRLLVNDEGAGAMITAVMRRTVDAEIERNG